MTNFNEVNVFSRFPNPDLFLTKTNAIARNPTVKISCDGRDANQLRDQNQLWDADSSN
jgi:hypothetical protein